MTTPTTRNMIASAANGIGISSSIDADMRPSAYTLGFALALSHMDYIIERSNGGWLVYERESFGKRTHVYMVNADGSVIDISGYRPTTITGKRAIAIQFYIDAIATSYHTYIVVDDYTLVERAFCQVVRNPHMHL